MASKNVAVAVGMVLVIAAGFLLARSLPSGTERPGNEPIAEGDAASQVDQAETQQGAAEPIESKPQATEAIADEILAALDELEVCAQRWDEQVVPLLTNAHGALLAGNPAMVVRFGELYRRVDSAQLRQTAQALRATVQESTTLLDASGDVSYRPSEQVLTSMRRIRQLVAELLAACRRARSEIDQLLLVAQRRPAAPGTTLQEAMARQAAGERR